MDCFLLQACSMDPKHDHPSPTTTSDDPARLSLGYSLAQSAQSGGHQAGSIQSMVILNHSTRGKRWHTSDWAAGPGVLQYTTVPLTTLLSDSIYGETSCYMWTGYVMWVQAWAIIGIEHDSAKTNFIVSQRCSVAKGFIPRILNYEFNMTEWST